MGMNNRYFKTGNIPDCNQVFCLVALVHPGKEGWDEGDPLRLVEQEITAFGAANVQITEIQEPEALALIAEGAEVEMKSILVPHLVTIYRVPVQ
jgi:hypothetical protein